MIRGAPERIVGKIIHGVRRHGKFILIDFAVTLVERRLLVWRPVAADGRG